MNVYDFDKTIYDGDSTVDFWKYCVRRYPKAWGAFPGALLFGVLFKLELCERELFKERFYRFLQYVPDVSREVCLFWDEHMERIKSFYHKQRRTDDLIISASPEFLIQEACRRLSVSCIASKVNPATGKLEGPNCRGMEKVLRFREMCPDAQIQEFYSDSTSDVFMAKEACDAFLVKNNKIQEWRL